MRNYRDHLIQSGEPARKALEMLNALATDAILFVVDPTEVLVGSLTDGDVRRGLLNNLTITDSVDKFIQPEPKFISEHKFELDQIIRLRQANYKIIPVLNDKRQVVNVINFRLLKSFLPLDGLVMAGGRGERLKPLTNSIPKPLVKVGDKAILQHVLDRLIQYGVDDIWLTLKHMSDQVIEFVSNSYPQDSKIQFVLEDKPLGTLGGILEVKDFKHDHILIMNSDILTNINFEDFFLDFMTKEADMMVATIPYTVKVPYAVMETSDNQVISFKEKPNYTYFSNGGIYLIKRELLEFIPKGAEFNATDLMELLIKEKKNLLSYPMRNYWSDIGKPEDLDQAKEDLKHIDFS